LAFKQNAGIQIDGGAGGSRSNEQHSFRIEPGHGLFGDGDLEYALLPDRPNRTHYESFYIRNGSNQWLVLPYKDALQVKSMGQNSHNYYSAYRPVVVYINGKYFGMYELREKINEDYLKENYHMDTDSLDLIGVSYFKGQQLEAIEGSVDPYWADRNKFDQLNKTAPDFLTQVDQFLDLDNYTDYIIAQSWIANTDWPYNNIKAFRCKSTGFRWQFALIDLEWSLAPNYWSTAEYDHIEFLLSQGSWQAYTGYWYVLMQNEAYKNRFINRFADLMNTNYNFKTIGPLEQSMYDEALPEMYREYERWSNSNPASQVNTFTSNHLIFRDELERRSSFVRKHILEHYNLKNTVEITLDVNNNEGGTIKISTISPDVYPWKGTYFSGIPIKVEAIAKNGYKFVAWEPNALISNVNDRIITAKISSTTASFKAIFEVDFEPFTGITITEINYKDGEDVKTTDWFELYNGTSNILNLNGWYFTDNDPTHKYDFESNVSIPSKGYLAIVRDTAKFKNDYPETLNFTGPFEFGLGAGGDDIHVFNASGESIVSMGYSDDAPWPLHDDQTGGTLQLINPSFNLSIPESWKVGCPKGSPGLSNARNCDGSELGTVEGKIGLKALSVYPVPARNSLTIEFSLVAPETEMEVSVYDILGKKVDAVAFLNLKVGQNKMSIDVSKLPGNAIYFLAIENSHGLQTVKFRKE
jgi:hypothetical protein